MQIDLILGPVCHCYTDVLHTPALFCSLPRSPKRTTHTWHWRDECFLVHVFSYFSKINRNQPPRGSRYSTAQGAENCIERVIVDLVLAQVTLSGR